VKKVSKKRAAKRAAATVSLVTVIRARIKQLRSDARKATLVAAHLRQAAHNSTDKALIRQFRADARRLVAIANHLRAEASELAKGLKAEERAERARSNFFSKKSNIDENLALTPKVPKEGEPGNEDGALSFVEEES